MIIVKIYGGLGNQMFQYAFGRALSLRNKTSLKLDIRALTKAGARAYALHHFSIQEDFAEPDELARFDGAYKIGRHPWIDRIAQPFRTRTDAIRLVERRFHFSPHVLAVPAEANVYALGGWQSERYFADVGETLRQDFRFRHPPQGKNLTLAEKIRQVDAISVHVRRGDYAHDPKYSQTHGLIGLEYYRQAISLMRQRVAAPHFFVFSDDPEWAMHNLSVDAAVDYVTHNGIDGGHDDIRLMSQCKHHIIANSTFSWWGAWLAHRPDQIVIGPKRWFANNPVNTADVLPAAWVRI